MAYEHNPAYRKPIELLPHRDDILLVTGLTELHRNDGGQTERVEAFLTPETKHFFDQTELRWMMLIESLAQAGAAAAYQDNYDAGIAPEEQPSPLFASIEHAIFGQDGRSVKPGDTVSLEVSFLGRKRNSFEGKGIAKVGDDIVCDTTFAGKLLSPRITDAFYDSLPRTDIEIDETAHETAVGLLPEGVFSGNSRGVWLDHLNPFIDETATQGDWLPSSYQFLGHAFGEKRNESDEIIRPATPLLPGIKHVGSIEDLTRAAHSGQSLRLSELIDVEFKLPILKGQKLQILASFATEHGLIRSDGQVRLQDAEADVYQTKATLFFAEAA